MKAYHQKINIAILLIVVGSIFSAFPENYTAVYLNSIRIGSQSIEIPMIVNTLTSQTNLFSNSNRKYAAEIEAGRQSDIFIEKVEVNGELISSFPFTLQIDYTKLNNADIQGEFGFGINSQNTSDLVETLTTNQIITERQIEIQISQDDSDKSVTLNFSPNPSEFNFCKLMKRSELSEESLYREAWVCRLSHFIIGSTYDELSWDNTIEIDNKVAFDSRTKYVYIPTDYMEYISREWDTKNNSCKIAKKLSTKEKYFVCDREIKEKLVEFKSLYLFIDGFGYRLSANDLFEDNGKNLTCLIRFIKQEDDIWILGIPFFKNYKMLLDYDKLSIGFQGENILNFTEEYERWVKEENDKVVHTTTEVIEFSNDKVMLMLGTVLGSLIILIVLFCFIRSFKRENPKYQIELNEQYDKKDFYQ